MADQKLSAGTNLSSLADTDQCVMLKDAGSGAFTNARSALTVILGWILGKANAWLQQQASSVARGSMSGAVSIDLGALASSTGVTWSGTPPTSSNKLVLTLTGNVTSIAFTGAADGANYEILFVQDATGGRTMPTLPAVIKFSGGTAPTFTTTANAVDVLCMDYYDTEGIYVAAFAANAS